MPASVDLSAALDPSKAPRWAGHIGYPTYRRMSPVGHQCYMVDCRLQPKSNSARNGVAKGLRNDALDPPV